MATILEEIFIHSSPDGFKCSIGLSESGRATAPDPKYLKLNHVCFEKCNAPRENRKFRSTMVLDDFRGENFTKISSTY